jgi:anti-anti-sigma factor
VEIEFHQRENATVLRIHGRLDANSAPDLDKRLSATISNGEETGVVLDLSPTVYVSSAGLRVLLAAAKQLKNVHRPLLLCGINASVMEVIETTGLHRVLEIHDTLEQALAALT